MKDCAKPFDCRRYQTSDIGKHSFILHARMVSTVPKGPGAPERGDREKNKVRKQDVAENFFFPVRGTKVGPIEGDLAVRVMNS